MTGKLAQRPKRLPSGRSDTGECAAYTAAGRQVGGGNFHHGDMEPSRAFRRGLFAVRRVPRAARQRLLRLGRAFGLRRRLGHGAGRIVFDPHIRITPGGAVPGVHLAAIPVDPVLPAGHGLLQLRLQSGQFLVENLGFGSQVCKRCRFLKNAEFVNYRLDMRGQILLELLSGLLRGFPGHSLHACVERPKFVVGLLDRGFTCGVKFPPGDLLLIRKRLQACLGLRDLLLDRRLLACQSTGRALRPAEGLSVGVHAFCHLHPRVLGRPDHHIKRGLKLLPVAYDAIVIQARINDQSAVARHTITRL